MPEMRRTTKWYIVDITELFLQHCTPQAVDLTIEYLGSLTALTDLCSHVALLSIRGIEPNVTDIVTNYILPNVADQRSIVALNTVVTAYTNILLKNFFHMEIRNRDITYLSNVIIHNARDIIPDTYHGDLPKMASVAILADFNWNTAGRVYDIQKYNIQRV